MGRIKQARMKADEEREGKGRGAGKYWCVPGCLGGRRNTIAGDGVRMKRFEKKRLDE